MAKQLTVRGVSDLVGRRLEVLSRERGQSVNATVLEILNATFDIDARRHRLTRYATWSDEDLEEFEETLRSQRTIDDELWR